MPEDGSLTPVETSPLIPRIDGNGYYEEGDRILAHDVTTDTVRAGIVGLTGSDGKGKAYMVVRYGEEPFEEAFLCTAKDVHEMLPDPEDVEELQSWLEGGA